MNDNRRSKISSSGEDWPTENGVYYYYLDRTWSSTPISGKALLGYLYVDGDTRFVRAVYPVYMVFGCSGNTITDSPPENINDSSVCAGKRNTLSLISNFGYTTNYNYSKRNAAVACSYCRNTFFNGGSSDEDRGYMPSLKEAFIIIRHYRTYGIASLLLTGTSSTSARYYWEYGLATNAAEVSKSGSKFRLQSIFALYITYMLNRTTGYKSWYDNGTSYSLSGSAFNHLDTEQYYGGNIYDATYHEMVYPVYPIWCPGGDHVEADGTTF